jgi:AraC-like DNA-binding protein
LPNGENLGCAGQLQAFLASQAEHLEWMGDLMSVALALCSGILGCFLAVPLLTMSRVRPASYWLGVFVLAISSTAIADYYAFSGYYMLHPGWTGIADWPVAAIGPAYYCYVCSLIGFGSWKSRLPHFIPTAVLLAALFIPGLASGRPVQGDYQPLHALLVLHRALPIILLACIAYFAGVSYRLAMFRKRLKLAYSATEGRDLRWITWLSRAVLAMLAIWLLACTQGGIWDWLLDTGRIALFYFVGWYGLRQMPVFVPLPASMAPVADEPQVEQASEDASDALAEPKYARSGMTEAAKALIGKRLSQRMQTHKDYLNNDLSLTDLAGNIGTSPQLLSQYLNEVEGVSFFDYINGLRIAAVLEMMRDPANTHCTLMELATAAGFNSKSHFNNCFRKVTGTTPSAWRKQHADAPESAPRSAAVVVSET